MTGRAPAPRKTPRSAKKTAASVGEKPVPSNKTVPGEITFRGRTLKVQVPQPEQIMIWQLTLKRLQDAKLNDWTGQQVMEALQRVMNIINSTLVEDADKIWLEDEMLAGRFGIKEAASILLDAVSSFNNRERRRATAKESPARRKKA